MRLLNPELATQSVVSLADILTCRELRQSRQQLWLSQYRSPLISLTLIAPGPIKDTLLTRQIFNLACLALQDVFKHENWRPLAGETFELASGAEALIAINEPAEAIKTKMMELEQQHPIGRLWDIDVLTQSGQILSRIDSGQPGRQCLVCNNEAKICGRNRSHSFEELTQAMAKLVDEA